MRDTSLTFSDMVPNAAFCRKLFSLLVVLFAGLMANGQDASDPDIVVLSPFQVLGKSLELEAHHSTRQGKKVLGYVRVKNVAKGSVAERAGLRTGDRIVAIGDWRLEGQDLTALNRNFPTTIRDGQPTLTLTVRRPHNDKEREVILPFPRKEPDRQKQSQPSQPTTCIPSPSLFRRG